MIYYMFYYQLIYKEEVVSYKYHYHFEIIISIQCIDEIELS